MKLTSVWKRKPKVLGLVNRVLSKARSNMVRNTSILWEWADQERCLEISWKVEREALNSHLLNDRAFLPRQKYETPSILCHQTHTSPASYHSFLFLSCPSSFRRLKPSKTMGILRPSNSEELVWQWCFLSLGSATLCSLGLPLVFREVQVHLEETLSIRLISGSLSFLASRQSQCLCKCLRSSCLTHFPVHCSLVSSWGLRRRGLVCTVPPRVGLGPQGSSHDLLICCGRVSQGGPLPGTLPQGRD